MILIPPFFGIPALSYIELDFIVFGRFLDLSLDRFFGPFFHCLDFEFRFSGFVSFSLIFFFGFIFCIRFLVFYFFGRRKPGSVECCKESDKFFLKKREKSQKNTKKGGPEKRSFFDPFVPGAIFGVFVEKRPPNSPPSGTFSIFFGRPRSCFCTVLVLVVGGVQSGGNFFSLFLQTFFRVCTFVFAILGVDIIPGGGQNDRIFRFPHCGIENKSFGFADF